MNNDISKRPTVLGVNITLLIVIALFFTVGSVVQHRNLYSGLLITEFGIIMLSALIYMLSRKMAIKNIIRLNPLSGWQALLVALMAASGYGIVAFLSLVWLYILDSIGELLPQPIPSITNGVEYLRALAVIAGSAAICEEILFRGVVLSGYEIYGPRKAIVYSGILFGLMHANIQNFIGPIFLGIFIGYVVYITDSIFAGMIAHFMNNSIALSLSYLSTLIVKLSGSNTAARSLNELPVFQQWMALAVWAIIGLASLMLFLWFLHLLKVSSTKNLSEVKAVEQMSMRPPFAHFIPLIIGLTMIAAELVLQMMMILGIINMAAS